MTLTEFLLARIAEDEAVARAALVEAVYLHYGDTAAEALLGLAEGEGAQAVAVAHFARHDPARVLAECEAKRAAIDAAWDDHERIEGEWGMCQSREQMDAKDDVPAVIAHLAAIYSDHPDYRAEWRP